MLPERRGRSGSPARWTVHEAACDDAPNDITRAPSRDLQPYVVGMLRNMHPCLRLDFYPPVWALRLAVSVGPMGLLLVSATASIHPSKVIKLTQPQTVSPEQNALLRPSMPPSRLDDTRGLRHSSYSQTAQPAWRGEVGRQPMPARPMRIPARARKASASPCCLECRHPSPGRAKRALCLELIRMTDSASSCQLFEQVDSSFPESSRGYLHN
ncbi:hypothetical protein GGTG_03336 [Gaeumannomyces tritici R3-111a-1]|uniref:Uncharacterized protein n=1 Tax=Gaeumannomyces tritici (strain R3-111a-1) TaxID=644352 RepID=J3NPX8_GAET3|nr:hypothetical protein GGTG_03336 [Gaeumannomyces tritici R3-111a-1]EJT78234.1 hypothetical protein GGTG_03336 [Gaeumannomyces tritici R3-111a-1]